MQTTYFGWMLRTGRRLAGAGLVALGLSAAVPAPATALINVTGGRVPNLIAVIGGTSLEDMTFVIENAGPGPVRRSYTVAAEICSAWRRDSDGFQATTCCRGEKRIRSVRRVAPPRAGRQLVLDPYVTQTFCPGAQAILGQCQQPPVSTDLVLTCEQPPRGLYRTGAQARFTVDVDEEIFEISELDNEDDGSYAGDGERLN
jgi:hypothetical protein